MSEIKESNFRTLEIKNFRNLGPFCKGTKDDINEDKEFLVNLTHDRNNHHLGHSIS